MKSFAEISGELRSMVASGELTAWNHRVDMWSAQDVWIITFNEGNPFPRTVEWDTARVEKLLDERVTMEQAWTDS